MACPISEQVREADEGLFFDYGDDWEFTPPAGRVAECAAGVDDDDLQKDMADDALINTDRVLSAAAFDLVAENASAGFRYAGQRLRIRVGLPGEDADSEEQVISSVRTGYSAGKDVDVLAGIDRFLKARADFAAKGDDVHGSHLREALAYWIDLVEEVIARPVSFGGFDSAALGDGGSSVADLIKG